MESMSQAWVEKEWKLRAELLNRYSIPPAGTLGTLILLMAGRLPAQLDASLSTAEAIRHSHGIWPLLVYCHYINSRLTENLYCSNYQRRLSKSAARGITMCR